MKALAAIGVSTALATLLAISHALLKKASTASHVSGLEFYLHNAWLIALALLIYVAVFFAYPYVLRFFPISVIFPTYTGLTVLLVMLFGSLAFGERILFGQYVGAALLIAGIALISLTGRSGL